MWKKWGRSHGEEWKDVLQETASPFSQALRHVRLRAGDIVVCAVESTSVAGVQTFSHFQDKYSPSEEFSCSFHFPSTGLHGLRVLLCLSYGRWQFVNISSWHCLLRPAQNYLKSHQIIMTINHYLQDWYLERKVTYWKEFWIRKRYRKIKLMGHTFSCCKLENLQGKLFQFTSQGLISGTASLSVHSPGWVLHTYEGKRKV